MPDPAVIQMHPNGLLELIHCVEKRALSSMDNSHGVTHDVPVPTPEPNEFPMSPADFYAHFLSPEETKIVRLIKLRGSSVAGKLIAEHLEQSTTTSKGAVVPNAVLSTTLRQLRERGLLICDDGGFRLSDYLESFLERYPMPAN